MDRKEPLVDSPLALEWSTTPQESSLGACVHQLVEAQVERTPDATAVVCAGGQWTYRGINARANQLAHYLRKQGVGPEVVVGVCLERSPEMVMAVLGVLKAGGAYLPLDPGYPSERLAFLLQDAQAALLLTQTALLRALPALGTPKLCLDTAWEVLACEPTENPDSGVTPYHLAYVIYTSGSTGRPKGVAIEHHSTVTLVQWARTRYRPEELRGVLAATRCLRRRSSTV